MQETMRPLEFGEVLDGAFTLLRRNFSVFFATAFIPQIPVVLFWLLAPSLMGPVQDGDVFLGAASLLLSPYSIFASILLMGALTHAAGKATLGERPTIGGSLGSGMRRFIQLAVVTIVTWILFFFGILFFIVPGLIVAAMMFAVYPVIMLEGRGPFKAMGRSRDLSRGARMRIFGIILVALLITYLPMIAVGMMAGVSVGMAAIFNAASFTGDNLWLSGLMQACTIVLASITTPFLMSVVVLLYYDRRARTEAPDLESALAAFQDSTV